LKVTTLLDLLGCLLVIAAVAVILWPLSVPGALAATGAGLLTVSWLIDRASSLRPRAWLKRRRKERS